MAPGRAAGEVGRAVGSVAEVFVGNRAAREAQAHEARMGSLTQLGAEFAAPRSGLFETFVNALNRLPRPMLALGTIGLFVYAMTDPPGFAIRMQGLAFVPEQLWWLLGADCLVLFRGPRTASLPDARDCLRRRAPVRSA